MICIINALSIGSVYLIESTANQFLSKHIKASVQPFSDKIPAARVDSWISGLTDIALL